MKQVPQSEQSGDDVMNMLGRILSLSFRISRSSPPMKPFIRFSPETSELFRTADSKTKSLFWDFDNTLQKILFNIVKAIAAPEQLIQACVERWKSNLEILYQRSKKQLDDTVKNNIEYEFSNTHRIRFVSANLNQGTRFLYIGCGQGTECLSLAKRGFQVIGIDTNFLLTKIANAWAGYLALPSQAICMDVMELGFKQQTFDSFLIEFYGYLPSLNQSFILQKNLARLLRKGAQGFVVAARKHYSSFWFLMGQFYPSSMYSWLARQAPLDYRFDTPDGYEERLMFGLYYRTHTVDSLTKELGYAFNIIECQYEKKDPRYVICTVESKENLNSLPELPDDEEWGKDGWSFPESGDGSIPDVLEHLETIGNFLESHEKTLSQYFKHDSPKGKSPLQNIPVELTKFLQLLEAAFGSLPNNDRTRSPALPGSVAPVREK